MARWLTDARRNGANRHKHVRAGLYGWAGVLADDFEDHGAEGAVGLIVPMFAAAVSLWCVGRGRRGRPCCVELAYVVAADLMEVQREGGIGDLREEQGQRRQSPAMSLVGYHMV